MSDKTTDSRPASQPSALLLMATAEFGGLSEGPGHSFLMPAPVRAAGTPQLLSPDEDAEADSFIGQTPASESHHHTTPFSMFQHPATTGHDPFSEIKQPQLEDFGSTRHGPSSSAPPPAVGQQSAAAARTMKPAPPAPLPQFTHVPFAGQNVPPVTSAAVPPAATSAPPNLFRMTGKPQYAAPPPETSYQEPQLLTQPGHTLKPGFPPIPSAVQSASVPFQSAFLPGPPSQPTAYHSMSAFLPRPFEPGPVSSSADSSLTAGGTPPFARDLEGETRSYQIHPPVGLPVAGQTYHPVQPHWFHRMKIEGKEVWKPFSMADSKRLEEAYKQGASISHLVSVQGGRYDVNVRQRLQTAIYWQEEASPVRRCSWFFRPDGENRFMPYEEEFAAELEESYKRTILTSDFHKRLVFPGGETIVIHNPQVIVQFSASAQPDAYGNTASESRPRVVKREVVDTDEVPEDESPKIDHLVLVVQGISATCSLRYRNTIDCVNSFRGVASEMMKSHFKQAVDERRAGRIEFLPVRWHDALHGHITGLDRILKNVTLSSVGKLRNFTNDHLLDTVVYRSPVYTQDIVTTVGNELNRLVQLFKSRNPAFTGGISLAGHSLGAQILFDILLNESSSMTPEISDKLETAADGEDSSAPVPVVAASDMTSNGKMHCSEDAASGKETLDGVLAQLGLSTFLDNLKKEQMDLNSLSLCEESDLKDMGLPLGPRKKLVGFLKNFKEQQERRKLEAEQKAQQMALLKAQEEAKKLEKAAALVVKDPLLTSSDYASVAYVFGKTGVGCPFVKYPQLTFAPENFFALGSSVAMFLAMKGVDSLGEDFVLPNCPGFFNIFHPFDPLAYRMEPLIVPAFPAKPVQIPHHMGRKRLHLELKESLTRIGYDLKQRIIDSVKSTWRSINSFATGHKMAGVLPSDEVEREVDTVLSELTKEADDSSSVVASSVADEDDIPIGSLNQGRRVDFVLQEKPIEIFNDYMFALGSYTCYWESEDTALMMLKEIYLLMGIVPKKPGADANRPLATVTSFAPPPKTGFIQPGTSSRGPVSTNPLLQATSTHLPAPPMGPAPPSVGLPPVASSSVQAGAVARPVAPSAASTYGPPPLSGFIKM